MHEETCSNFEWDLSCKLYVELLSCAAMHYVDINFAGEEDVCAQVQSFISLFLPITLSSYILTLLLNLIQLGRSILNQANLYISFPLNIKWNIHIWTVVFTRRNIRFGCQQTALCVYKINKLHNASPNNAQIAQCFTEQCSNCYKIPHFQSFSPTP